jgi:short-subunit dehydrogenase
MKIRLLPISEQVMVITGASSGIGLVTAKEAVARGGCVVLVARNGRDLQRHADDIRGRGGRAIHLVADVADHRQKERIAEAAIHEFGRIDSWVNNAAVSMYGASHSCRSTTCAGRWKSTIWGQVYGSMTAVRHLRTRGGALINVGSALCDRAIPLQANYCAAKHALKGFTDALRMELEEEGAPISVTLVKPASIDTPFFEKARTYLGFEPQPVPPVYAPEVVSEVILEAGAAADSRADRRRIRRQTQGRSIRTSARRFVHGAVDLRFAAHGPTGKRPSRQSVWAGG